ncbi:synaptonemal complex central element protein 2 [Electrophorus electricus]|uniref:synaptonemal complex central element protein 2 n=1 Tax=Electrophorus electricus TaxID=8005 RepID=UPI0015D0405F|nr:synaptonemal complex central element protein 2 [Electrophorus electricus]
MAQRFFGHPTFATLQSTPKVGHHSLPAKGAEERDNQHYDTSDEALSFVTLDDNHEQQSEDSGINLSSSSQKHLPGGDNIVNTQIDDIGKKAQDLIERINQSRAMDQKIMNSFEEKLMQKVSEMCQQVKEQMFEYYEEHSQGMQAKLIELTGVLERSNQLSLELQDASQTLAAINKGLQQSSGQ